MIMARVSWALLSGLLLGTGLLLSGMADPANVLGFFDLAGTWNPSLAFVMGGGLTVTWVGYRLCLRRAAPLCDDRFQVPARSDIDGRLIGGAVLFGIGWGIAGYCPGPALSAAAAGLAQGAWFVAAMLAGMAVWGWVARRLG